MIANVTRSRRWIAVASTLALITTLGIPPAFASPPGCSRVQTRDPKQHNLGARQIESFSASKVIDLVLESRLPGSLRGEHVLKLRVFTPRGHLFRTIAIPFATTSPPVRAERKVLGYGRPISVQQADKRAGTFLVTASFPLAGTTIVKNALYGRWKVEASLDGRALALCQPATFSLDE